MLVLSVDVHQQFRQPFQDGKCGQSSVYAAFVFAVRAHFSADEQNFFRVYADAFEILRNLRREIIGKDRFHGGEIRPVTYE